MPWFPCPRQAAGGVLVLEASPFVRACFRIRRWLALVPWSIRRTLFPCSWLRSLRPYTQLGVELDASTCVRILSICTSVRVPLTDILDSSPRVSIRALALEWRLFLVVEFPWGRASYPAGVAPEPLEEFF